MRRTNSNSSRVHVDQPHQSNIRDGYYSRINNCEKMVHLQVIQNYLGYWQKDYFRYGPPQSLRRYNTKTVEYEDVIRDKIFTSQIGRDIK